MLLDSFFGGGWGVLDWGPWFYGAGSPDAPWRFWSYRDPESSFLETFRILSGHWGLWFYRVFGVTVNARFYREWECIWTEPLNYSFSLLRKGISKSKEDLTPGMTDFILWKTCSPMCCQKICVFPQQRRLMVSSAQKSSGVNWCRRRARFNEPGHVQQGSGGGSGEGLGGFGPEPVRFNRVPENVPVKVWEALVQSQVKFNSAPKKAPKKVPEKVPGGFRAGSGEGGRLWCRARSSSTALRRRFRRRFREAFVQVPEKVGGFGAEPGQVQQGSFLHLRNPVEPDLAAPKPPRPWNLLRNPVWEALVQIQAKFNRVPEKFHASERFVKTKRCGCWGYHRSLFHWFARGGGLEVLALQGHVTQPFPSRKRRPWLLNHVPLCWDMHRTTER